MNKSISWLASGVAVSMWLTGCSPKPETRETGAPAEKKDTLVIGFAQTGAESGWRLAHTKSVRGEAEKRGIKLQFVDCQSDPAEQVKALYSFINQKVDAIVLSPIKEEGWEQVFKKAKQAGIPILLLDRSVEVNDETLYTAFIGSDFIKEGRMAGEWLVKQTGGKGRIVELEGEPGSAPANDRATGFREAIKDHPDLKIIASQSGFFRRADGKQVMEALLKKHGDEIEIVYAHNDDMAIGAIQAIEDAGKKPGEDIVIVSVDALGEALKLVDAGKINCTVECSPLLGPQAFDAVAKILAGETLPKAIFMVDRVFDKTNAAEALKDWTY